MDFIKIIIPTTTAFFIGIAITPLVTDFLYRHKMWKKKSVQKTSDGYAATITSKLHNDEERKTPRMGGVVTWGSVFITTIVLAVLGSSFPDTVFAKLSFLSRDQTWLPLFTLVAGGLFGVLDDYFVCRESGSYIGGGLSLRARLAFVGLLGLLGGWWFYAKLGMHSVHVPFGGDLSIGLWFIPLFVVVMIASYSGGIIDGIDGLAGGVYASIFSAYGVIAFMHGQINIAAFAMVVVGGILAFLWFNIPPARFINGETGTMALTTSLVVIAFLTNAVLLLPIIAFLPMITSLSSLIQIVSKRFRGGKKVFLVAPLHNHFQVLGWPPYKVTMRYWVLSIIFAALGVVVGLAG